MMTTLKIINQLSNKEAPLLGFCMGFRAASGPLHCLSGFSQEFSVLVFKGFPVEQPENHEMTFKIPSCARTPACLP